MKYVSILIVAILFAFSPAGKKKEIAVKNLLTTERHEIVAIPLNKLKEIQSRDSKKQWIVKEKKSGEIVLSQVIDNKDAAVEELVFEVTLASKEEKSFIIEATDQVPSPDTKRSTYSRLVPERIDDYAWENDLVAFRTYGPEAQRLVDAKEKGGTLTSGMDCWLKRVNYPVIDKWYKKYVAGGSYHKDDQGEGYDPYHVGDSRGCGGIGVWKNDSLYVSKNFISYKKIAEGPVRNIFELTYAPWQADGITINETKRITIDLGNQMYKVEDKIKANGTLPNITIGVTLHDKKGKVQADQGKGWFSYWEPVDDSEIGTGIVIDPKSLLQYEDYRTTKKDLSQLHIIVRPEAVITYYPGFGWSKAGVITSPEAWSNYLGQFAQRISSPLQVSYK